MTDPGIRLHRENDRRPDPTLGRVSAMRDDPGNPLLLRRMVVRVFFVFIFILASLYARPLRAFVLTQDELYGSSTTLGLDIRSYDFLFSGPLLKPPYAPDNESPSTLSLTNMRLYFSVEEPWLKVVVHNQLTDQLSSGGIAGLLNVGRGPLTLRWLPMDWTLVNKDAVFMEDSFDWAYVSVVRGPVSVTAGRQPITFGRGKIWSPMDVIAPFSLTDVDTEYKPGVDALRMDITPSDRTNLTFVAAAGKWDNVLSVRGSSFAVRATQGWSANDSHGASAGISGGELGFFGGLIRNDKVVGLDGLLNTSEADLYAEATLTMPDRDSLTPRPPVTGQSVVKGIAGMTFKPADNLTVSPEVLFNGFGAQTPSDYLRVASSDRMAIGEIYTMGRIYAAETAVWQPYPLLNLTLATLVNLQDPSALFVPALQYSVANSAEISAGAYLPAGRLPAVNQNPPLLTAPEARSEFGLYPDFFFLELRLFL